MFWIPHGWAPYYAEWLLSFPRAPVGSISIQAWALACGAIILLVSDALVALLALVRTPAVEYSAQGGRREKIGVPGRTVRSEKAQEGAGEEKKEL